MKNIKTLYIAILFCFLFTTNLVFGQSSKTLGKTPIILAYVTSSESAPLPDPTFVTHINYAFGSVSESFDDIIIQNENRLREISDLKKSNPSLKVLLSIGGWTSGRFSEMAADTKLRELFAQNCKRVVDQFNLDGIDLDWEYPTSSMAGISSSPEDTENFTLLMRDIRATIGRDKLLTLASASNAKYIDFRAIDKYIDFVNIMTYDMGRPPFHNSPLYQSEHVRKLSADESVDAHIAADVPISKLTLGVPFYGHGIKKFNDFVDYKDLVNLKHEYTEKWDSKAQVPYLVDTDGDFVCSFDNPKSLEIKCKYLLDRGMLGVMYWEYNCDDTDGTLRKAIYNAMTNQ
ncbi:glycoside hydrolase family 18 protein [Dysgonomonas sp. GY617]|uniref:glycoside hydrolase family 18 protein n=1 Tax=Dysgonomonas sp. GY617 TaxID=2780420 RepID=UPI0018839B39|nr:glycosyl hydrolase family 18 protein [Dysgonomonas sp. GY617]MBF0575981.1 glycoside hydrolase [Dysgonomonas sp. GY617]